MPRFWTAEHSVEELEHPRPGLLETAGYLTKVLHSSDLLRLCQSLLVRDNIRVIIEEFVFSQVTLEGRENQFHSRNILRDLLDPFARHILERIGAVDLCSTKI